jgi:uncharacterized membrane protein YccC
VAGARELYDACDAAAAGRPAGWRPWPQPPVLWLTSQTVTVGERTWRARHHDQRDDRAVHGFTARQCDQISRALLPVLECYGTPLESITRHMC